MTAFLPGTGGGGRCGGGRVGEVGMESQSVSVGISLAAEDVQEYPASTCTPFLRTMFISSSHFSIRLLGERHLNF